MGVEPTILASGDRINGFEGHEGHRTPFASAPDYSRRTLIRPRSVVLRTICCFFMRNGALKRTEGLFEEEMRRASVFRRAAGKFPSRQIEQLRVGAHFVVDAPALRADLRAGQKLAHESLADHNRLERFAQRHFSKK